MLIKFWKPYGVLTQFSDSGGRPTLADFVQVPNVYAAGRLDMDSEGLLLLTDDGTTQARLAHPKYKVEKTYFAQVEGAPTVEAIQRLREGVELKDGRTQPALAEICDDPGFGERNPPIRERKNTPTSWIRLVISEGKNRQVRRMTAAVGFPTLRLIRWSIGDVTLEGLGAGQWQEVDKSSAFWRP